MRYVSASVTFASTHRLDSEGAYLHGHSFCVLATELGTDQGVHYELHPDLSSIVSELDRHNLGEMLVGGSQELDGIAAWIMERLLLRHPRLTSVEVWTADHPEVHVGVTREIR